MSTLYELLRCKKGAAYAEDKIKDWSFLHTKPAIDKPAGALAGNSRVHGDAPAAVQDRIIDMLVEIGARYKLSYRDIAHMLLICKLESGFNPDAAAGTTSAAGLGQYTAATVEEAAKPAISKKRLGFILDLSGDYVLDAERGAYGVLLSFMIAKEKAISNFGKRYENYLYLFHHEGWYFNPTEKHMAAERAIAVLGMIKTKIVPHLSALERLLGAKTDVAFKLITKDDKPYIDQPYAAIIPSTAGKTKAPNSIQAAKKQDAQVIIGKTDGQGKTDPFGAASLSEVIFIVLNKNYKDLLNVNKSSDKDTYTVKKNDTLANISKRTGVSVAELQKINDIKNPNKIHEGQDLKLHDGEYLWRRPPLALVTEYLQRSLNMHGAAAAAIVEHKRSHIVLPKGNVSQSHAGDQNIVAIRGGATGQQLQERKEKVDIPHKTVEKDIKKKVEVPATASGKEVRTGLLFPLPARPQQTYHENPRKFGSNRSNNRKHGGIDLYGPVGTVVRAMADGVVIQVYPFYLGTWAVEVDHGSFIARYGELRGSDIAVQKKEKVNRGQELGRVGKLTGLNFSMLHLELYSTTESPTTKGRGLTQKGNPPYQRRDDLFDPTESIDKALME